MTDQARNDQARNRALRTLGPFLPAAWKWFNAELEAGTSPQDAAEAIGFVMAHAAAGVAAVTPSIERQVVDWLTWEARNQALGMLAANAGPRSIARGPRQ